MFRPFRRLLANLPEFRYEPLFQYNVAEYATKFRSLGFEGVKPIKGPDGKELLSISADAITKLTSAAMTDINYLYRTSHLAGLRKVYDDPEASTNDKFVAYELLRNACISAGRILPSCQDTGTATTVAYRGERIITEGKDEQAIYKGVFDAYRNNNFRYSQVAPLTMFSEKNTGTNLPCQVDIFYGKKPMIYDFLFVAKGGGSANKAQLFQKTKALLNDEKSLEAFLTEKITELGTAACPPYHLAVVIGGLSAELCLKSLKLLSTKYLDGLPSTGNELGRAFRDHEWEDRLLEISRKIGIGAQFGGKYFAHDARVLRLPRHGASLPVAIGVSCSADRQAIARISRDDGVQLEQLEEDPAKFMPSTTTQTSTEMIKKLNIDELGMSGLLKELSMLKVKTRVALTGTIIVARDIAHSKISEKLKITGSLPEYFKNFPIYYAGPAKKPDTKSSGSFGPTTSGRMDSYLSEFQSRGGSLVTIGKGNRSKEAVASCKANGGFYLGSIGGAAAALAESFIKDVQVLDFSELGMEAVWKIQVEDFPAFVVIDNKGNDFFQMIAQDLINLTRK